MQQGERGPLQYILERRSGHFVDHPLPHISSAPKPGRSLSRQSHAHRGLKLLQGDSIFPSAKKEEALLTVLEDITGSLRSLNCVQVLSLVAKQRKERGRNIFWWWPRCLSFYPLTKIWEEGKVESGGYGKTQETRFSQKQQRIDSFLKEGPADIFLLFCCVSFYTEVGNSLSKVLFTFWKKGEKRLS